MAGPNSTSRYHKSIDMSGRVFGRWTVLEYVGNRRPAGNFWKCRCECGTVRDVDGARLRKGKSRSCGCLQRESTAIHIKHGMHGTPEYAVWQAMLQRCGNPNHPLYSRYGGRGITVCERWKDMATFIADMGPRPLGGSIDRLDNDKGYEPSNCQWRTNAEQSRNTSRNRFFTMNGQTKCLQDWANEAGIEACIVNMRMRHGWEFERALTTPVKRRHRRK